MSTTIKVGDRLADVRLGSMGGTSKALRDLHGRKILLYVWSSW